MRITYKGKIGNSIYDKNLYKWTRVKSFGQEYSLLSFIADHACTKPNVINKYVKENVIGWKRLMSSHNFPQHFLISH